MNTAEFDTKLRYQPRASHAQPQVSQTAAVPVPIVVLSSDTGLCEAIRTAAADQHPLLTAASLEEAMHLSTKGHCGILVTDQALSHASLARLSKQMRAHDPATITIAVGSRGDDNALIGLLSSAVVERFMLKPVTPALAKLVLRSATSEYQSLKARCRYEALHPEPELCEMPGHAAEPVPARAIDVAILNPPDETGEVAAETLAAPASPVVVTLSTPVADPAAAKTHPSQARAVPQPAVWIAAAAAAVVVGVAVWWTMRERIPDIDPRQVIATNLAAAAQALAAGRYTEPAESSALHYYSTVLSLDPANLAAGHGMDQVTNRMIEDVKRGIDEGRLAEAGIALERVRHISPDNGRLRTLDAQLRKEQASQMARLQSNAVTAMEEKRPEAGASMNQAAPKATVAGNDSRRSPPVVAPVIAAAELSMAAAAVRGGAWSEVNRGVERDSPIGNSRAVDSTSSADDALRLGPPVPPSASAGAVTAAAEVQQFAGSAAPPASVTAPPVVEPKLVKMVEPDYPKDARNRGVEGWVDMTLGVTGSGEVVSARVDSGKNARWFDRAAVTAVRKWLYEPRAGADPNGMQPVKVRVAFRLQD